MSDEKLWAPWRAGFILSKKEKGCIFCKRLKEKDSVKNLIVYRGQKTLVILNKFPYNAGHTMIVPIRHVGQIEKLKADEAAEFFELLQKTVTIIKKILKPTSMNLGMNLGKASGAGVPGHLHMHIVPRWTGDTNFMPIIGKTKVVSLPLDPIYKKLRKEFMS
ncbi:MAG: HIT domain-containing protein [candidate division Zixibacteria bacterium]|nr:HIT domain-containing protein [candidate division Zixibacteria bacterium]